METDDIYAKTFQSNKTNKKKQQNKKKTVLSKHVLSKQILALENEWVVKNNILNCLMSLFMQKKHR